VQALGCRGLFRFAVAQGYYFRSGHGIEVVVVTMRLNQILGYLIYSSLTGGRLFRKFDRLGSAEDSGCRSAIEIPGVDRRASRRRESVSGG
jgi:hypothetical protein